MSWPRIHRIRCTMRDCRLPASDHVSDRSGRLIGPYCGWHAESMRSVLHNEEVEARKAARREHKRQQATASKPLLTETLT